MECGPCSLWRRVGLLPPLSALPRPKACQPNSSGAILNELRRADVVVSQRGTIRGYRLARPPDTIAVADVIRALDGPLAAVRGLHPESIRYDGAAAHLQEVWVALRASMRSVLEGITLEDVVRGGFSQAVTCPTEDPRAWEPRSARADAPTATRRIDAPALVAQILVDDGAPQ